MYNRIAGYKQYYKSLVMLGVSYHHWTIGGYHHRIGRHHHGGTTQYGGTSGGIVRQ